MGEQATEIAEREATDFHRETQIGKKSASIYVNLRPRLRNGGRGKGPVFSQISKNSSSAIAPQERRRTRRAAAPPRAKADPQMNDVLKLSTSQIVILIILHIKTPATH